MPSPPDATDVRAAVSAGGQPSIGDTFGSYRLESPLGRGGMGVVFRAIDDKLHRAVAIKFLADGVADASARERFRLEAETASSLNHPHIVAVYDVGEHDGRRYIVSELVDGGTLADWARTARKDWRPRVELMIGVADALAAAHAAGVLHRDVKPGNILLDANGYAKLADFGLAKLTAGGAGDGTHTAAGIVIGTVAYMSPEQTLGQPLDARSDVFSFGVVLYELIAGRRPFDGNTDLEVMKAVAQGASTPLPQDIPDALRNVIEKALEKDPAERYQSMRELVVDLRRVAHRRGGATTAATAAPRGRRSLIAAAAAAGIAGAVLALLGANAFRAAPAPPGPPLRLQIAAPEFPVTRDDDNALAISPDGTLLAYRGNVGGKVLIVLRRLDGLDARPLAGTEDAVTLFWSPDNRYVAFTTQGGALKKAAVDGGVVQLADAALHIGGTWNDDGVLLFPSAAAAQGKGLALLGRIPADGGSVERVTAFDAARNEVIHVEPWFLPEGKRFLYTRGSAGTPNALEGAGFLGALDGRTEKRLIDFGPIGLLDLGPQMAYADGYVVFRRRGDLFAQRFDLAAEAFTGEPALLASNVRQFSVSRTGVLVYRPEPRSATVSTAATLRWVDRAGDTVGTVEGFDGLSPRLSRAGSRIVAVRADQANTDVWSLDIAGGASTRLTFDPALDTSPVWTGHDEQIVYASGREGGVTANGVYERAANGLGADQRLFTADADDAVVVLDATSDGREIVFLRGKLATFAATNEVWRLSRTAGGESAAAPLLHTGGGRYANARLSPDGRWLAYSSNESGPYDITVQPYPDVARGKWQVSTAGGSEPVWRADGRELFYLAPSGELMGVEVKPGDAFDAGRPHVLFQSGLEQRGTTFFNSYDAAPDGERFLMAMPGNATGTSQPLGPDTPVFEVIVNWPAAIERRASR